MPFTAVNYAAGLTRVPLATFLAVTAVAVSPRAFAYAALGGSLDDLGRPEALVAIGVLIAMAVGGLLLLRRAGPGRGSSSPAGRSAGPR